MSELQKVFEFQGKGVRTIADGKGVLWFVAKDVCDIVALGNPSEAMKRLDDDEKSTLRISESGPEVNIINESGLYSLLLRSSKPEAKKFKKWVTSDVLPSIREKGSYGVAPILPDFTNPAIAARAWADECEKKMLAEAKVKELQPKAEFFDAVTGSSDAVDIGTVAKVLNMGVGRNNLFELLRNEGVLMNNNQPFQRYVDSGCFRLIEQKYTKPDGSTHISIKTVVYQKGINYIRNLLLKNKTVES